MWAWKLAVRQLRRHGGRTLLSGLSVAVGVGTVLAVALSSGTTRRIYQQMYETINGRAALEVTKIGGAPLEQSLLPIVAAVPGVAEAVPLIQRETILYYTGGKAKLTALGIDPTRENTVRDYNVVAGEALTDRGGVLLDASLARSLGIRVGDEVQMFVQRGNSQTRVVGLVSPQSGAAVSSGGLLFMPLRLAQSRFGLRGQIDRIQVVLDSSANPEQVQAAIQHRMPLEISVQPPRTYSALAEETTVALDSGLRLATGFAVAAAFLVILNTILMSLSERNWQLAVLRALGATRGQVASLIFRDALILGGLGTAVGLAIGPWGAIWLNRVLEYRFQTVFPPLELRLGPILLAALFGMGLALGGACVPAWRATRCSPAEGIRGLRHNPRESLSPWTAVLGGLAAAVSLGLFSACLLGWLPIENAVLFAISLMLSLVLLLPLALRPLTWLVQVGLSPWLPAEANLARRQLLRHRARTGLTIGVLFVALATSLGLATSIQNNVEDVRRWYRTVIVGDFFVRATSPDLATGMSAAIPESIGDEIAQVEGVTRLESVRFVAATAAEKAVIVIANQQLLPPASPAAGVDLLGWNDDAPPAPEDSVTIGSVLAQRAGLSAGDSIVLQTTSGPRSLPIRAVVNEYLFGGLGVHMDRRMAERYLGIEGVDGFIVKASPERTSQVESQLQQICQSHGFLLQSYRDLTAMIERIMAGVVASLWGLLALALTVAGFGLVNTLGMNILEQTRELGLLRVVAMTRGQLRRLILIQALMLAVLGILPGAVAGVGFAWIMNLATLAAIGHPVPFFLTPGWLLGGVGAALAICLLAAWFPAQRAARISPLTALRYE